jgi:hypothetical protein
MLVKCNVRGTQSVASKPGSKSGSRPGSKPKSRPGSKPGSRMYDASGRQVPAGCSDVVQHSGDVQRRGAYSRGRQSARQ